MGRDDVAMSTPVPFLKLKANAKARILQASGKYQRAKLSGRKKRRRSQEMLFESACQLVKEAEQSKLTTFEPHRAPGAEV